MNISGNNIYVEVWHVFQLFQESLSLLNDNMLQLKKIFSASKVATKLSASINYQIKLKLLVGTNW